MRYNKRSSNVGLKAFKCDTIDKTMGDTYSDDIAERADEIEALSAIFESSMAVNSDDNSVSDIIICFFLDLDEIWRYCMSSSDPEIIPPTG